MSAALPHSSSSPKLTFEDLAIDDLRAYSELDELVKLFKCSRDVIGNVIGESDLKPLFEQYKREFDVVLQNDLIKCNELEGVIERAKCVKNIYDFPFVIRFNIACISFHFVYADA